ncbi:MAG: WD40/YVTN/BNR-like repeat-containing protein [Pyrinomonadaceae bacterium]
MIVMRVFACAGKRLLLRCLRCCLLLLLFIPVFGQSNSWIKQHSGSLAWLHSVFFFDQNRGWAVGSKGTLLQTVDGGDNWRPKPQPTVDVLRDIYFLDEQNGWLVCETNVYELKEKEDPRTYLMQTTDGGETWKRVNVLGTDVDGRLVRAVFSTGGRGWTFGENGAIFTTRDAGLNWTRLHSPTRHLLLGGIFIDQDRGWLVGAGATIIQTSDGGETWHVSRLPQAIEAAVRFTSASFVDNRIGWTVGSAGAIYHTENGGRTWQQQRSGVDTDLSDVKFLDSNEGWACGAEGTIIYTSDGGAHWTRQVTATAHPLEKIFLRDRNHGWAVGFGGTVVSYVRSETPKISGR